MSAISRFSLNGLQQFRFFRELLIVAVICVFALGSPTVASALSLDEAKQQGLVGEEATGYLGAVKSDGEVSRLVTDVNNKRKSVYAGIAQKNGTTVSAVEALAGKKAIENTAPGHYFKNNSGQWQKK